MGIDAGSGPVCNPWQHMKVDDELLKRAEKRLATLSSRILSNFVMVGQIPAPTGDEGERADYLLQRFSDVGLEDIGQDSAGNVFARRPGQKGEKTIGLFAGMDTIFSREIDCNLDVTLTRVTGPGVAYDSLATSALVSLAEFLSEWEAPLQDDVVFVGLARCADQADQEGMRTFLESPMSKLDRALMLESIELGRLSYFAFGCLKFDLTIELPQGMPSGGLAKSSAINILADAVDLLLAIELPRRPKTVLNLGVIEGGLRHELWATKARLGAEIRCEKAEVLSRIEQEVDDIAGHLSSYFGCRAELRKFGRRTTAGLRFSHPMVRTLRGIMKRLGVAPAPGPDTTAGSLIMAKGIPTVTLGLTRGVRAGRDSYVDIDPIRLGLLQVILALHELGGVRQ